ncbi:UNKNOWN [Stylonychia lemnae]|uniref:Uncharacterized protein n=1 Tax=Stylonychia lemnae TaxID=5949 RepID=A0A078AN22_STYLE|nr:UNKNOWN [Stylonychia lemnae]|eukprot:CDW82298.1 UNKNOWN [Stylonychia lemnae]
MSTLKIFAKTGNHKVSVIEYDNEKMNSKVSTRFIEQWVNEILTDCQDLNIPGTISKPEHKQPLSRYGMDRMHLTNQGIPNDLVNRIYNSLFVYTLGFYSLIKEATKNIIDERIATQSKIWKVYQILLEYCCRTDYLMITQQIELVNQQQTEETEGKYKDTIEKLEKVESELKGEMRRLQTKYDDILIQKNEEKDQKSKLLQDFQKTTQKHEEEVQLRLYFESKLNSLHHVNRALTTKFKNQKMKLSDLMIKHKDLQVLQDQTKTELDKTIEDNFKLRKQVEDFIIKQEAADENIQDLEMKLRETEGNHKYAKMRLDRAKQDLELLLKDKNRLEMDLQNLRNFVEGRVNEHSNVESYLSQVTVRKDELEQQLMQVKMIEDRNRKKIQFYKSEFTGYDLSKQQLEGQINEHRTEIRELQQKKLKQQDKIKKKQHQVRDLKQQLEQLKQENAEINEQNEQQSEEIKNMKQTLNDLEYKQSLFNVEKSELDNYISQLEAELEALKEKYSENNRNLKLQALNEKDSRDGWKDRYEKQTDSLMNAESMLNSTRLELQEVLLKYKTLDRLILDANQLRDAFKHDRDSMLVRVNEATMYIEKLERELNTKRKILEDYDAIKKVEVKELMVKVIAFEKLVPRLQMTIEDHVSDLLLKDKNKLNARSNELNDQCTDLKENLKELEQKLSSQIKITENLETDVDWYKIEKARLEEEIDSRRGQFEFMKIELQKYKSVIGLLEKADAGTQIGDLRSDNSTQTEMTFEKGRMIVYQQNGPALNKNKNPSKEDLESDRKLKPMFQRQPTGNYKNSGSGSNIRPYKGLKPDLILEEGTHLSIGEDSYSLNTNSKNSKGSRNSQMFKRAVTQHRMSRNSVLLNNSSGKSNIVDPYQDLPHQAMNQTMTNMNSHYVNIEIKRRNGMGETTIDLSQRLNTANKLTNPTSSERASSNQRPRYHEGEVIKRLLKNAIIKNL